MSKATLVPAQPGWWARSVIMTTGDSWELGQMVEVVAWQIMPIIDQYGETEDFVTFPVTIYGTLDGNFGIACSPSGKWYSPDVPGAFASAEDLAKALMDLFNERHRRRAAAISSLRAGR